jgi:hypothetical protein
MEPKETDKQMMPPLYNAPSMPVPLPVAEP